MLVIPYQTGPEVARSTAVARFGRGNRGRIENTTETLYPRGGLVVTRECITGTVNLSGDFVEIKDYVNVSIDGDSGELTDFSMRSDWGRYGVDSPILLGTNDGVFAHDDLASVSPGAVRVGGADLRLNVDLPEIPDIYENAFQVPYVETAGAVLSFFTTINLIYPYELHVVIDTDRRIEVVKFQSGNKFHDTCESILRFRYMPILSRLFVEMREECRRQNLHLLILVVNYPYGTYARIKNKGGSWFTFNLNASENSRVLMTNEYHDKNYWSGQVFSELCKTRVPTVAATLGVIKAELPNIYTTHNH